MISIHGKKRLAVATYLPLGSRDACERKRRVAELGGARCVLVDGEGAAAAVGGWGLPALDVNALPAAALGTEFEGVARGGSNEFRDFPVPGWFSLGGDIRFAIVCVFLTLADPPC